MLFRRHLSLKPNFSKLKLIPQPPGHIVGTVNEASAVPAADHFHGSYHWSYERAIAVSLVPLTIAPFVSPMVDYPLLDSLLSSLILLHSHIGFQSCIIDYIPKRVYGIWHKLAMSLLTLGTSVSLYGIYLMETTDNGLTSLIGKIFA